MPTIEKFSPCPACMHVIIALNDLSLLLTMKKEEREKSYKRSDFLMPTNLKKFPNDFP